MKARGPWRLLLHALAAAGLLAPALRAGSAFAPGSPRTDVEDGLWGALHLRAVLERGAPLWRSTDLNHPDGGVVLVADPLGAALIAVASPALGLGGAATALVALQLTLAGWLVHHFAVERAIAAGRRGMGIEAAGLAAGWSFMTCGTLLSVVHNGSSEGLGAGAIALSAWMAWRTARAGRARDALGCALGLGWAALQGPYIGALALGFAACLLARGPAPAPLRAGALCFGLALALPWAAAQRAAAAHPDALLHIKGAPQLHAMRRSTGPADPRSYLLPLDARAPDIARLGRGGEAFLHCGYLGWITLLVAIFAPRAPGDRRLLLASLGAGLLSLGPTLLLDGRPLLLGGRALPLPFAALEQAPGFSSLSLLWRLGLGLSLGLALRLGSAQPEGWLRIILPALVLAEAWALNPAGRAQRAVEVEAPAAIRALAAAPPGAVLHHPAAAVTPFLLHQAQHGHPVAATLNIASNPAAEALWRAVEAAATAPAGLRCDPLLARARSLGLRYIVEMDVVEAAPDPRGPALRAALGCARRVGPAEAPGPRAWALW
ncbi:MAG: hypothetical protein JNM72_12565 [Deltaproteobacteria bacterium]|nr:hypothetical protein [Deltaproteobacteria bacterium]